MFQTKLVAKIKIHVLCSITSFRKSWRLWDNVETFCTEGQATWQYATCCMLDNYGYKHTLRICNATFPPQQWCTNVPQLCAIHILPVLSFRYAVPITSVTVKLFADFDHIYIKTYLSVIRGSRILRFPTGAWCSQWYLLQWTIFVSQFFSYWLQRSFVRNTFYSLSVFYDEFLSVNVYIQRIRRTRPPDKKLYFLATELVSVITFLSTQITQVIIYGTHGWWWAG
jgi:hypothetical protein